MDNIYNGPARPFENPKLGAHTPMGPSSMMNGCKISTLVSSQFPSLKIRKGCMEPFFQSFYPLPSLFSSSCMAMISTTNLPLAHFPSPSHRPISLSSLFPSSSSHLSLSSKTHFSHLFLHRKQPIHATPTTLTVKSMAPPKPGGKPKKGICFFVLIPLLGTLYFPLIPFTIARFDSDWSGEARSGSGEGDPSAACWACARF